MTVVTPFPHKGLKMGPQAASWANNQVKRNWSYKARRAAGKEGARCIGDQQTAEIQFALAFLVRDVEVALTLCRAHARGGLTEHVETVYLAIQRLAEWVGDNAPDLIPAPLNNHREYTVVLKEHARTNPPSQAEGSRAGIRRYQERRAAGG